LAILTADEKESIAGYVPEAMVLTAEAAPAPLPSPTFVPQAPLAKEGQRIPASPLARKLAVLEGIPLEGIKGTGPGGRIMSRDLEEKAPRAPKEEEIIFPIPEGATITPVSQMRLTIGKRLQYAKSKIPHFYATSRVEVSDLLSLREQLKAEGKHITVNDLLVKASALALMAHPSLRCSYFPAQGILQHEHADVAVAVTVPGGLITPIVFQAETKSVFDISKEVRSLADKAKAGKLQPQEYSGGAFTISNLGMYGVDEFFAILNPPQVAILAVGAASETPIVKNGTVVPGKELCLTLSADHRAVDGTDGAAFLKTMKELLSDPKGLVS
jgi:pyruvate dehydrogenase E2 component (dihydrolipoamide acetyltransferase)